MWAAKDGAIINDNKGVSSTVPPHPTHQLTLGLRQMLPRQIKRTALVLEAADILSGVPGRLVLSALRRPRRGDEGRCQAQVDWTTRKTTSRQQLVNEGGFLAAAGGIYGLCKIVWRCGNSGWSGTIRSKPQEQTQFPDAGGGYARVHATHSANQGLPACKRATCCA